MLPNPVKRPSSEVASSALIASRCRSGKSVACWPEGDAGERDAAPSFFAQCFASPDKCKAG